MANSALWPPLTVLWSLNNHSFGFAVSPTALPASTFIALIAALFAPAALALAKHIRANRPADAEEARMIAAANVLRHLRPCGRKIEKDAPEPGTGLDVP